LNFVAIGGGKGSCLAFAANYVGSVTNPFMVTAAFTIFFGLEALFIRFLAIGCAGGSARQ
jgi:hypothetical protein